MEILKLKPLEKVINFEATSHKEKYKFMQKKRKKLKELKCSKINKSYKESNKTSLKEKNYSENAYVRLIIFLNS